MKINEQKLNEFVGKAVNDLAAGYGGVMVGLGHKLGLYRAMAGAGPLNSHEVASRSGCAERYVREWLNSQAAGGYVLYHAASATYELTPEQAMVLADQLRPRVPRDLAELVVDVGNYPRRVRNGHDGRCVQRMLDVRQFFLERARRHGPGLDRISHRFLRVSLHPL